MESTTITALMDAAKAVGYGEIPPYQHCECFTVGAFDLILINSANKERVFELLDAVCAKYNEVKEDKRYLDGFIYLLTELARSTDTTEMPSGIRQIITDNPEKTRELQDWYRLKG